jgi:L-alanine-DL-glutamate epimerase-like enolase superfamily enzyme
MAANDPRLTLETPAPVPILGLLQGETAERMQREAERLIAEGYGTVKVKVGFDPMEDARVVAMAQRAVAGRARIRIDANQGFDAAQAIDFVSRISDESIELFEQPCAAGDWSAHTWCAPRCFV